MKPPTVFLILSVIMVSGFFACRSMMGILAISHPDDIPTELLLQTIGNGINAILVLLALFYWLWQWWFPCLH